MGSNQVDDASRVYSCSSSEHSMMLLDSLNQQRLQGILCDTKIEVESRTFSCHSNVLAASLGYFRDLLKKDQLPGFHRITEIVKATGFSKILDFVYTAQLKLSQNTVLEVMCAAAYLQSSFVVSKCNEFISRRPANQPPLQLTDEQKESLAHLPKPQSASELLHQLSNQNVEPKNSSAAATGGNSRIRNNNNHQHQQQQQHVRKASSPKRLRDNNNEYDVMAPGGGVKRRMPTPRPDTASPSSSSHPHLMNGAAMTSSSTSPFNFAAASQHQLMNQSTQQQSGIVTSSSASAASAIPNNAAGLAALGAGGAPSQLGGFFNFNSSASGSVQSSDHNNSNGGGGPQHPPFSLSMYPGAQQQHHQGDFQQQRDMQPGTSSDLLHHRQQSEHSPFQHLLSTMPINGGPSSSSPSNGGGTDLMSYQRGGGMSQAMRVMASSNHPNNNRVISTGTYNVGMPLAPSTDRRVAIPGDDLAATTRRSRSDRTTDIRSREKKEYFCTMCPKSFGRQQHLKRHILTHTGERPYPCKLCDKRFRRSEHLKHHMTSHTNSDGSAIELPQPKRRRRREPTDIYQMSRQLLAANAVQHGGGLHHYSMDGSQSNYPYPSRAVILPLMASAAEGNGPTLTELPNNGDIHHHHHPTSSGYDVTMSVNSMSDDIQVADSVSNIKIEEMDPEENQSPNHETSAVTLNGSSPHDMSTSGINEDVITSRPGSSAATNSISSGSPSMPDAAATTTGGIGSSDDNDEGGATTSSTPPMPPQDQQQQQPEQAASSPAKSSPLVNVENSEVLTEDMKQLMRSMNE